MTPKALRERLRKIQALHLGDATPGECAAAREALRRIQARLAREQGIGGGAETKDELQRAGCYVMWQRPRRERDARGRWTKPGNGGHGQQDHQGRDADEQQATGTVCMTIRVPDLWSKYLLLALARLHGLKPRRPPRWPKLTLMLEAPEPILEEVFLPQFDALGEALADQLTQTTKRFICEKVDREIHDRMWTRWARF